MSTINQSITINAAPDKVWQALATLDALHHIDRAVKHSAVISANKSGLGATRKVDMNDNKNWFKEKVSEWQPNEKLSLQLVECSFPVHSLDYDYVLKTNGNTTTVTQTMNYTMKFGLLGKLMDTLMVKKKWNDGVKLFQQDLKSYVESH